MKLAISGLLIALASKTSHAQHQQESTNRVRRGRSARTRTLSVNGEGSMSMNYIVWGSMPLSLDLSMSVAYSEGGNESYKVKNKARSSKSNKRSCGKASKLVPSPDVECTDGYVCFQNKYYGKGDGERFNLDLSIEMNSTLNSDKYRAAYSDAHCRWTDIITGDSNPFVDSIGIPPEIWPCSNPLPPLIDDLHICAIDFFSPEKILGSAGPTILWVTETQKPTPLTGFMEFNTAYISEYVSLGLMEGTILHEMGHVLGLGTIWDLNVGIDGYAYHDLIDDNMDYAVNTKATAVWQEDWGCVGTPPIEKDYGPETAFRHWDEECLGNELMTGFSNLEDEYLSKLTIASMEDLGYKVDYDAADDFDGSDTPCCNAGAGSAVSTQNKPTLSDSGRDTAVAYGQNILRERQLPADVALLLEDDTNTTAGHLVYVGDKMVTVLYMEDDHIFEVFVTNKKNDE